MICVVFMHFIIALQVVVLVSVLGALVACMLANLHPFDSNCLQFLYA